MTENKLTKINKILLTFETEKREMAIAETDNKAYPYALGFHYKLFMVPLTVVRKGKKSFPCTYIIEYQKIEMAKKDFQKLKNNNIGIWEIINVRRKTKSSQIPKTTD